MDLAAKIRPIENVPVEGVTFRDITPLLGDPLAYQEAINWLAKKAKALDAQVVLGIEARGFIVGAPVAYKNGCGFVPVRKPGKLPAETVQATYTLEYGTDTLEMHKDAIKPGDRVVIVDDLLATGGTAKATVDMVRSLGGEVAGCVFLIELPDLGGRKALEGMVVESLLRY